MAVAPSSELRALADQGRRLLFGQGVAPSPQQGLDLLLRAARAGEGSACLTAAVLAASGAAGPKDWPRALDFLQRGAAAGDPAAQGQLRLLADPSGPATGADWPALRRAVDLEAWRAAPPLEPVSNDPQIAAAAGFLAPPVCDWLMAAAAGRLTPAAVIANQGAGDVHAGIRTSTHAGFDLLSSDLVVLIVRERLASAAGLDVRCFEAPQVLHYAPGEEYRPHFDFLRPELPAHAAALASVGQRCITLLVYLNDAYEGGETEFPQLGLKHRGRLGELLMFRNADAAGRPDPRMLHAGLAPTSGEKWLLSQWVRDRPQP